MNFLNSFIKAIQNIFTPPKPAAKPITLPKNTPAPKLTFQSTQPSTTGTASKPATLPLTKPVSAPPPTPTPQNKGQSQPTPQQTSGGGQPSAPVSRPSSPPAATVPQASLTPRGIGSTAPVGVAGTTMPISGGLAPASALPGQNATTPGGIKGIMPDFSATTPSPSALMIPSLPGQNTGQNTTQVQKATTIPLKYQEIGIPGSPMEAPVPTPVPGEDIHKAQQQAFQAIQKQQNAFMGKKLVDVRPELLGTPGAIGTSTIDSSGKIISTASKTPMASQEQLQGSLKGPQINQAIQSHLNGTASIQQVAPAIASQEGLASVNKAITKAQKAGDMTTVGRLADLHSAVQQQLNFITQIGQIVSAISGGFGTQNAPGVTAARTPMVQQGIGQALTTAAPTPQTPGGAPGQQIPYMPPNLPTAPVQQNKPIFPWAR